MTYKGVPVQVVLWLRWQVIVDDQGHLLHINTTCQQVSSDQHPGGSRSELTHDDITSVLVHVTVGCRHGVVTLPHLVCQPVNLPQQIGTSKGAQ